MAYPNPEPTGPGMPQYGNYPPQKIREHLSFDKSSHIFKQLRISANCRFFWSEECFDILN